MKALHLTSHPGTIKNIENVFYCLHKREKLVTEPSICPNYYIDETKANQIWNTYSDKLNDYRVILFTDTSMVARPFLQNIDKHNCILIIYITNRFDWGMWSVNDPDFYNLYQKLSNHNRVIFCSDNKYDQYYATIYNIRFLYEEPINLTPTLSKEVIPYSLSKFFIYNRGTKIEDYKSFLKERNIHYDLFGEGFSRYKDIQTICEYKGFIHLPYQTNIQSLWENLGFFIIYFIPSKEFILKLITETSWYYWEERYRDSELLQKSIELSQWYQHPELFEYFSSWDHLQEKIENITDEYIYRKKGTIKDFIERNNEININKWEKILNVLS
jgi:hypothetical protein